MKLFQAKPVGTLIAESEGAHGMKRELNALNLVSLGIGSVVGAGIFVLAGTSAAQYAGPAIVFSFIISGLGCLFAGLCYAEFATMIPVAGSAYTSTYATMGEFVAWIIGWDLILEYAIGNVAVAISWAGYFTDFVKTAFGWDIPIWLRIDYRTFVQKGLDLAAVPHVLGLPVVFNVPALCIVLALTVLLVIGIKESTAFNNVMVGLKLVVLAIFIGVGIHYFHPQYWKPFAPGGWKGIQVGAATVFFAYIGFDAVSTVAEETKDPKRDMPIGIIGSLAICTVVYILVTVALTGMIPVMELKSKIAEPLIAGLEYNHSPVWLIGIISLGSVIAHTAVLLVFQMGQPRIFFAMSRDGLLPQYFAKVHPRFKTPYVTTIWTGVIVGLLAGVCNIDEMANLCNIGTLFAFILVCIGVMILRVKDPDRPRPFRLPGGPVMPLLGIGFCLYLMLGLGWMNWLRFGGWLVVGLIIYFFHGSKKSVLRQSHLQRPG